MFHKSWIKDLSSIGTVAADLVEYEFDRDISITRIVVANPDDSTLKVSLVRKVGEKETTLLENVYANSNFNVLRPDGVVNNKLYALSFNPPFPFTKGEKLVVKGTGTSSSSKVMIAAIGVEGRTGDDSFTFNSLFWACADDVQGALEEGDTFQFPLLGLH